MPLIREVKTSVTPVPLGPSLASQTYFARERILRAPRRGEGENTSGVFGQVFVRSRNVISHVILLFHETVI